MPVYWTLNGCVTFFDVSNSTEEIKITNRVKSRLSKNVRYTNNTFEDFDPKNNHLLGVNKKIIVIGTFNGLSVIPGSTWVLGDPKKLFTGKIPTNCHKIE
jgi:hypothetical protein